MSEVQYGWVIDMNGNPFIPLIAKEGYFGLTAGDIKQIKEALQLNQFLRDYFDMAQMEGRA